MINKFSESEEPIYRAILRLNKWFSVICYCYQLTRHRWVSRLTWCCQKCARGPRFGGSTTRRTTTIRLFRWSGSCCELLRQVNDVSTDSVFPISVDFVHFAPSRVSPPRKERSAMMHNRSKPCAYLDCTRWPSENRVPSVRCYLLQKPRPHSLAETGGYFALRSFLIELLGAGGVFLLEIIIRRGDEMDGWKMAKDFYIAFELWFYWIIDGSEDMGKVLRMRPIDTQAELWICLKWQVQ